MIDEGDAPTDMQRLLEATQRQLTTLKQIEGYARWTMVAAWLAAGALLKMTWWN